MEHGCTVHKLVADIALFSGRKVLFVKYRDVGRYDGQRGWFLPDDFLAHMEHPEAAAKRIAREQTGVWPEDVRLSHIESFGNGAWHLIFHYRANVPTSSIKPGPNVAATAWFDRTKLPPRSDVAHAGWAVDVLKSMGP
ncbi:MAG: NUDIX hydrolase [Methanobacteriota archaeon]|nr:MAG: NUDIX hydrolase [Euryarchaeota archaeon]